MRFVCVEVTKPVNPMGSCGARSVYLTTLLLGRLGPLSGYSVLCIIFRQKLIIALLESAVGRECRKYFMINLHERMSDAHPTEPQRPVERCGVVVKHRTRDREVPGSIPTNSKCCFLEQETLSTLLSTGFYPGKKRATWKISTRLLNVLPSINKVDYYYYYYKL